MSLFIRFLAEPERLFPVGLVWDDSLCASVFQPFTQLRAVVRLVTEQFLGGFAFADQTLRNRAIVRLTAGQEDGKKTAFSICNCVDFRIAPAARASNRLLLFPPFPPDAERCALM